MKQQAKIKNWRIDIHSHFGDYVLIGQVFDHPKQDRFQTEVVVTSPLLSIDFTKNIAETQNTIYSLEGQNESSN